MKPFTSFMHAPSKAKALDRLLSETVASVAPVAIQWLLNPRVYTTVYNACVALVKRKPKKDNTARQCVGTIRTDTKKVESASSVRHRRPQVRPL